MKKIFVTLAVSSLLVLSCSKEKTGQPDSLQASLNAIGKAPDRETKQQIYSEMSAADKYLLWQKHFLHWLDSAGIQNDKEKYNLIVQLYQSIQVAIFENDSKEQHVFLEYTLPGWITQAKKKFTDEEIFELIMVNYVSPVYFNIYNEELPNCFCHIGNSGYSCKKLSIGSPSGVKIDYGLCEQGGACDYSRRGCGAFWLSSCNGSNCNF